MALHNSRGRNLHPVNFAKELFLRFNLPPLHNLLTTYIPTIVAQKLEEDTQYYRKLEYSRSDKLKFKAMSASIGNFRKEERKSHIPLNWVESDHSDD